MINLVEVTCNLPPHPHIKKNKQTIKPKQKNNNPKTQNMETDKEKYERIKRKLA